MPTLLVADDHPLFLKGFALLLLSMDSSFTVHQAGDLASVKHYLTKNTAPDLLILDRVMPGMDGMKAVSELRRMHSRLPIAIISASEDAHHIREALASGVSGFIPKTTAPDIMLSAVKRILQGGVYVPEQAWRLQAQAIGDIALSARQKEVLSLIAEGDSNKVVAQKLNISEGTVKLHMTAILKALEAANRTQAVQRARLLGFIQ